MNITTRTKIGLGLIVILVIGIFIVRSMRGHGSAQTVVTAKSSISNQVAQTLSNASTTFGNASTSTVPAAPARWDATVIASRHVAFTAPTGYWVYFAQNDLSYWLVKGTAPKPGSPDPIASALAHRVAIIHPSVWDHDSFPTYERFATTMAQFDCVSGVTANDLISCLDTRHQAVSGKTVAGLPFEAFSLEAIQKSNKASKGMRAFVVVRLGVENDNIILLTPTDQRAANAVLQLAKSMKISMMD